MCSLFNSRSSCATEIQMSLGQWSLPAMVRSMPPPAKLRPLVVGLRREDPTRIWERRAPLTPDAVNRLVSEQRVKVHVEHCDRRVFRDHEYVQVRSCFCSASFIPSSVA
jgi:hypothetical protein